MPPSKYKLPFISTGFDTKGMEPDALKYSISFFASSILIYSGLPVFKLVTTA